MSPALTDIWNQHLVVLSFLKRLQLLKSRIDLALLEPATLSSVGIDAHY